VAVQSKCIKRYCCQLANSKRFFASTHWHWGQSRVDRKSGNRPCIRQSIVDWATTNWTLQSDEAQRCNENINQRRIKMAYGIAYMHQGWQLKHVFNTTKIVATTMQIVLMNNRDIPHGFKCGIVGLPNVGKFNLFMLSAPLRQRSWLASNLTQSEGIRDCSQTIHPSYV